MSYAGKNHYNLLQRREMECLLIYKLRLKLHLDNLGKRNNVPSNCYYFLSVGDGLEREKVILVNFPCKCLMKTKYTNGSYYWESPYLWNAFAGFI